MALTKTDLANIVEGILPVANGGSGSTSSTGSGAVVLATSPTLVTPALGTPSSGTLTNCTFPTLNQNTTGTAAGLSATLAIASGGTNSTATATAGGIGYGTGTAHAYTAAGTSGQVLQSNGASAPTWGAVSLPAGTIKQVVNGTISTAQSTSSASATNSGLTASITPASTSNKVFITITSVCGQNYSGRSEFLYLYKNGSQVFRYELFLNTVSSIPITITYLDSPATTSSTSYALWFSADGLGPASVSIGNTVSSIILMEVVG